jgi:hypothetical protein
MTPFKLGKVGPNLEEKIEKKRVIETKPPPLHCHVSLPTPP